MSDIAKIIHASEPFLYLRKYIKSLASGQRISLIGIRGSLLAFVISYIFQNLKKQVLVVTSDEDSAERLRDDCALLIGEMPVRYFAPRPLHDSLLIDVSAPISQIETLKSLVQSKMVLTIACSQSIIEKLPSPNEFLSTVINVDINCEINFLDLIQKLENFGFQRKDFVEGYGDYSVRGGIVDIFPYIGDNPLRIEFWGNTIESIREFDVVSQRSIRKLDSISIVPSIYKREELLNEENSQTKYSFNTSLIEYLQKDALVILNDPIIIQKEIEELFYEGVENILGSEELFRQIIKHPLVTIETFSKHFSDSSEIPKSKAEPETETIISPPESKFHRNPFEFHHEMINVGKIEFHCKPQPIFNGSINRLIETINKLNKEEFDIYLACDTKEEARRLQELIEEVLTAPEELSSPKSQATKDLFSEIQLESIRYKIIPKSLHSGFIFQPAKIAVLTEHEIFGRLKHRTFLRRRATRGLSKKEFLQLKPGDFVVHTDYGIGQFERLTKIQIGGIEQEVMKLKFYENDVLYVNINFLNRVQKYKSKDGYVPNLSKLGSEEWERTKARAKRKIKDIARDLITLYARRKHEQGYSFSPDTHWQKELEASFIYEDTPDQERATLEVKQDMEAPTPMDRLICGDVGFGKTEVAVRASFKCVMDGKQVAMLVPTTILATQHYNTFLDRLGRYPVRIDYLTRFRSKKEQMKILEELQAHSIDIIIGTHRLLSDDVKFKDLGLLIIDEEHRFGVTAKEKLRKLKASVDTLTLTATPIPRTLQFSLMGARDLSLITTPPRNRLPVITEIIPTDSRQGTKHWRIIREAILRELHRKGQVYFVHDRVEDIDSIAEQVQMHIPEARVRVAHGQMPGHELEKTMEEFLEHKIDILVCTKIIESGLDIPNVNTIIINRADRFGLAELYQLRGRVGRSNVQAYSYLLIPPLSIIPRNTLRRLQAIEEFTELGSGFNLAMRDLEIRGAGNLFGAEQSGFILEMGFETYERIVREAIEELKRDEFKDTFKDLGLKTETLSQKIETTIESDIKAIIPDHYIESDVERLDIYRRLSCVTSGQEVVGMREELRDRFGKYPPEVENLFLIIEIKLIASHIGIQKVEIKQNQLTLTLPDTNSIQFYGTPEHTDSPFQRIIKYLKQECKEQFHFKQSAKILQLEISLSTSDKSDEKLIKSKKILKEIADLIQTTNIKQGNY